ncbi:MAG: hypothetical protein IH582_16470 [Afipia sp.]|nr:hypothetical protein [Afipia sp.]
MIPTFIVMFGHVLRHYNESPMFVDIPTLINAMLRFVIGIAAAIALAVLASGLYGLVGGNEKDVSVGKGTGSRMERFWWSFMRVSGLLIIPLVFGHLAIAHMVQGVFDLNLANATIGGVPVADAGAILANGINNSGTAVEYVAERWNFLIAGVALWRIYDAALLALVTVHGFNGLRYVLTDYTMDSPLMRRAVVYLCFIGGTALLVVGVLALLGTIDTTAVQLAEEAKAHLIGLP